MSTKAQMKTKLQDVLDSKLSIGEQVLTEEQKKSIRANLGISGVDVGVVIPFAGNGVLPPGFLLCNGSSISKSIYESLFNCIGYTYGGEGDYFKVPDLTSKFIEGHTDSGLTGGSSSHIHSTQDHTLTVDEMPSHSHKITNESAQTYSIGITQGSGGDTPEWCFQDNLTTKVYNVIATNTGGSLPHNHGDTGSSSNIPPFLTMRYIIKAFDIIKKDDDISLSVLTQEISNSKYQIDQHTSLISDINSEFANSVSLNRNTTIGNRNNSWDNITTPGYYNVVPGSDWDNSLGTPNTINSSIYKYGMLEVSMAAGTLTQKYISHAITDGTIGGIYLRMKWAGNTDFVGWTRYIPALGIYPVGSIYMSVNSTNPGTLFGGTWEQLQNRFLLGAGSSYTNGATGGEASHTLTIGETPSHRHWISNGQYDDGNCSTTNETSPRQDCGLMADAGTYSVNDTCKSNGRYSAYGAGSLGVDGKGTAAGTTAAHNNMPPYLVVYIWKRTA